MSEHPVIQKAKDLQSALEWAMRNNDRAIALLKEMRQYVLYHSDIGKKCVCPTGDFERRVEAFLKKVEGK